MVLTLIDARKAFDSVSRKHLLAALRQHSCPEAIIRRVESLYDGHTFIVQCNGVKSRTPKEAKSGVKQGCPLSPYLFVIFMTVLFHGVEKEVGKNTMERTMDLVDLSNILYADDTLLITKDNKSATRLLQAIEEESKYYNMKLNKGKCNVIAVNKNNHIKLKDGTILENVESAKYFGGIITRNANPTAEIENRISETTGAVNSLNTFWKKAKCPVAWKLKVYNAVIINELTYGLETIQMTDALNDRAQNRLAWAEESRYFWFSPAAE